MAIDKLGFYNGALRLCEERALASLTENREPRRLLDNVWSEDVVRNWLEEGQWQFATRAYALGFDPDFDPAFGYQHAFEHPDDYVRLVGISADEKFNNDLTEYRDEGGYWMCDLETLYVRVVSDDVDYGRDMTKWPPSFVRFAQADLACEINPRLTGSRVATDDLQKLRAKRLSEAQGKDGVNRPTQFYSNGTFSNARLGRTGRDNRRSGR